MAKESIANAVNEVVETNNNCRNISVALNSTWQKYLGDGVSKGFLPVVESKQYGPDLEISKLECIGHVQKRMRSLLRN